MAAKTLFADCIRNPNDIDKYVSPGGDPIGKPIWTWIPGGSLIYLVREIITGRTPDTEDYVWATVDLFILVPGLKGTRVFQAAGKALRAGELGGTLVAEISGRIAAEGAAKQLGEVTLKEVCILLLNTGIRVSQTCLKSAITVARWVLQNPRMTTSLSAAGLCGLCALYPEKAAVIIDHALEWVKKRLENLARQIGTLGFDLPGEILKGLIDQLKQLAKDEPMLLPLYLLLSVSLFLVVVSLPLIILRLLLPDVFKYLQAFLAFCLAAAWGSLKSVRRALAPRQQTR